MSFEFENEGRDVVGLPLAGSIEDAQAAMEKQRSDKLVADGILREQKIKNDKARADSDKESQVRAAELLEKNAIEVFMEANPNYSWHSAKYLFDTELKQLIAIENFKSAYFGQKQTGFDDVRM